MNMPWPNHCTTSYIRRFIRLEIIIGRFRWQQPATKECDVTKFAISVKKITTSDKLSISKLIRLFLLAVPLTILIQQPNSMAANTKERSSDIVIRGQIKLIAKEAAIAAKRLVAMDRKLSVKERRIIQNSTANLNPDSALFVSRLAARNEELRIEFLSLDRDGITPRLEFNSQKNILLIKTNGLDPLAYIVDPITLLAHPFNFEFENSKKFITAAEISPDGNQLATCDLTGEIILWDIEQEKPIRLLGWHGQSAELLKFSKDQNLLVSSYSNGRTLIWTTRNAHLVSHLTELQTKISSIFLSPKNQFIVTSTDTGNVMVSRLNSGRPIAILQNHFGRVRDVTFNQAENILYTTASDGVIHEFDLLEALIKEYQYTDTKKRLQSAKLLEVSINDKLNALASVASPKLQKDLSFFKELIAGSNYLIWRISKAVSIFSIQLSPDHQVLALNTFNGQPVLFHIDQNSANKVAEIKLDYGRHSNYILATALNKTGSLLATGDIEGGTNIIDTKTGHILFTLPSNSSSITAFKFANNDRTILVGNNDGDVQTFEIATGKLLSSFKVLNGPPRMINLIADNTIVATRTHISDIPQFWDARSGLRLPPPPSSFWDIDINLE
jgi:WD40 repeat protein